MDFEDLKILYEVSKYNSISKASEQLHLTQPTISKKINRLEKYLGIKLFNRSPTGVELTKEGNIFFQYSNRALVQLEEGMEQARIVSNKTIVKIAAPSSYSEFIFSKIIPLLEEENLIYEFYHFHSRETLRLLNEEIIDIGLLENSYSPHNIVIESLYKDPILLCCSTKYNLKEDVYNFNDITNQNLALFSWGNDFNLLIDQLITHKINPSNFRRLTPASIVKRLILEKNYISFMPFMVVSEEIESGLIKQIKVKEALDWNYNLSISYKNTNLKKDVRKTLDLLREIKWS